MSPASSTWYRWRRGGPCGNRDPVMGALRQTQQLGMRCDRLRSHRFSACHTIFTAAGMCSREAPLRSTSHTGSSE